MRLYSITLQNIRSYENSTITFPQGSVLLSGDIGAGKSTVLLAIEFALFGIIRGSVDGESLLRHGANAGSVTLSFECDNKQVSVCRNLRRSSTGVSQAAGYLELNGARVDCTPVELKSRVLELLGYPSQLVSKSKELMYRYTVYTPQEDMKRILFDDKTARLNTLRRVFQIEKYKQIRENASLLVRHVREKKNIYAAKAESLEQKKHELNNINAELLKITNNKNIILPSLETCKKDLEIKKTQLADKEKEQQLLITKQQEYSSMSARIQEKKTQIVQLQQEIKQENNEKPVDKSNELAGVFAYFSKKLQDLEEKKNVQKDFENHVQTIEQQASLLAGNIQKQQYIIDEAKSSSDNIKTLDVCAMCQQKVSHDHKEEIFRRETEKLQAAQKILGELQLKKTEEEGRLATVKKSLEESRNATLTIAGLTPWIDRATALKVPPAEPVESDMSQFISLINEQEKVSKLLLLQKEREALREQKAQQLQLLQNDLAQLTSSIQVLETQLKDATVLKDDVDKLKSDVNSLQQRDHELTTKLAVLDKELENYQQQKATLDKAITEMQEFDKKASTLALTDTWFQEFFIKLTELTEKQVMLKVYQEFNEYFRTWFDILMEDDSISAHLDDSFSPVVEQNGYETAVENLSGGEKTSCALAYRLSLNKVINNLVAGIKTMDFIILDEPTDGFSAQQLEKIRDVLDQLQMQQTILVSHEPQIESFVDHVLRIKKENGSTVIL